MADRIQHSDRWSRASLISFASLLQGSKTVDVRTTFCREAVQHIVENTVLGRAGSYARWSLRYQPEIRMAR